jgi:hypothetical protein
MTTIYDEQTEHSRLVVGYDRYGITVREWSENDLEDADTAFICTEGWFSWERYWKRERLYSGDDGTGRMQARIVAGAISLLAHWGGENTFVDSLQEVC